MSVGRKILAFAGLGHPATLTEEQTEERKKVAGNMFQLPEGRNEALFEFFLANIIPGPVKNGCDHTKHFRMFTSRLSFVVVRREWLIVIEQGDKIQWSAQNIKDTD